MRVRKRRLRSARDDGFERRALETAADDAGVNRARDVSFRPARPDFLEDASCDRRQSPRRFAERLDLVLVLSHPQPFDDLLGRHERGRRRCRCASWLASQL